MPPLPPKPKGPAVVPHALVVAALATSSCARTPPRIGQPPPPPMPVRIGAQACSEALVTDGAGNPVAGVQVRFETGLTRATDERGRVHIDRDGVEATIEHPGFHPVTVSLYCDSAIALQPVPPPVRIGPPPPPRIGPPPVRIGAEPVPNPRIGMAPVPRPPPRIGKAPPQG